MNTTIDEQNVSQSLLLHLQSIRNELVESVVEYDSNDKLLSAHEDALRIICYEYAIAGLKTSLDSSYTLNVYGEKGLLQALADHMELMQDRAYWYKSHFDKDSQHYCWMTFHTLGRTYSKIRALTRIAANKLEAEREVNE